MYGGPMGYVKKSSRAPQMHGRTLRAFVRLLENPGTAVLLAPSLMRSLGVSELRAIRIDEEPTPRPRYSNISSDPRNDALPLGPRRRHPLHAIRDYAEAFTKRLVTPEDVAERFLRAV